MLYLLQVFVKYENILIKYKNVIIWRQFYEKPPQNLFRVTHFTNARVLNTCVPKIDA